MKLSGHRILKTNATKVNKNWTVLDFAHAKGQKSVGGEGVSWYRWGVPAN